MDMLFASVLLVISASTVSGWRVPAQQPQDTVYNQPFFPTTNPGRQTFPVVSQPLYTDPWGVLSTNPGRQTFPVSQPNTNPWVVQNTNPGRQTFPVSQPNTDPWGVQNTNPGRQTFPVSQPNTDPWGVQNTNPGRQTFPQQQQPQQQGNQCQTFAANGDCRFYDCFNFVEQQCSSQGQFLVNDMQSLCQGSQQLSGRFSSQGQQYLHQVSTCIANQMTNVVNSQSCNAINFQASSTLFGQSSTAEDCYWQNQLFCNVVSNPQDSQTLVAILFGGNAPYNPQYVKVAEHLQSLAGSCPQPTQNIFQDNFTNRCPAGTVGGRQNQPVVVFPTQPMMMMGGPGGD